jgi:uncharacterized protein YndB with AHSA1/START domain
MWWLLTLLPLAVLGWFFRPTPFTVRSSRRIARPRAEVFARIRDLRSWKEWSPWLIAEPDATLEYTGESTEVGGMYSWDGPIVGAGEIEHTAIDEPSRLDLAIRFTRPFKSKAGVAFEFSDAKDGGTEVTWSMRGKMMAFFVPMMRTMIGMDYKRGLHRLGDLMETGSIPSKIEIPGIVARPAFHWVGIGRTCKMDAIAPAMEGAISELKERLTSGGITASGPWLTFYTRWDFKSGTTTFICAAPLDAPAELDGTVSGSASTHRSFHVTHTGPYHHIGNAWFVAHTHTRARKLKCPKGGPFPYEVYTTEPGTTPEHEIQTDVFLTIR